MVRVDRVVRAVPAAVRVPRVMILHAITAAAVAAALAAAAAAVALVAAAVAAAVSAAVAAEAASAAADDIKIIHIYSSHFLKTVTGFSVAVFIFSAKTISCIALIPNKPTNSLSTITLVC